MSNWKKIEINKPPKDALYIVYEPINAEEQIDNILNDQPLFEEKDGVACAYWSSDIEMFILPSLTQLNAWEAFPVTHWDYLPEPPKE